MKEAETENYSNLYFLISDNFELVSMGIIGVIVALLLLKSSLKQKKTTKVLKKVVANKMNEPFSLHPEIDEAKCLGCGDCTRACPEGEVLQLINHKAVLIHATKCVGHGLCEQVCPLGAIDLVFGTKARGMDIPRISQDYETNIPGLYIAGELGGMGLIRNAVRQGQAAAEHAMKNLTSKAKTDYDLLVVGAGPAGFAAGLEAKKQNKKYVCLEQNSFGGTVYNFPRQKIVMTIPFTLPIEGEVKFSKNVVSKEDLLERWDEIRIKNKVNIKEKSKFDSIVQTDDYFTVGTPEGKVTAKKVILAMGVRGSPRKLGLENEDQEKVAYNLIDPEQYQKQHVGVVGGGNAAVEAAQYLCKEQYGNTVSIFIREDAKNGLARCAEDNRNLLFECEEKGLINICYYTSVKEIHTDHLILKTNDGDQKLENNYLFIFAGAEVPHKFLMSLGIKIDKKFGTKLGS
ncbi:MAG: NAD(P)-binding domain-containing protein [Halobacteriovoraceae bacterium]|jgi:thioredoxin reductase (NADPH)|nr:NAD(P)-binding domain-containing protein [Halobacteriovoraceae bacterium]